MEEKLQAKLHKANFLENNQQYAEVCCSALVGSDNSFQNINPDEEDIWLVQCARSMDLSLLQGHKMKLPGRKAIHDFEAVAVEIDKIKIETFGFCNRKGHYSVRTLPIKGNIVYRERLKTAEALSIEKLKLQYPLTSVPIPEIKVRHPLLGALYKGSLKLDKEIVNKLKKADEESVEITRDILLNNNSTVCKEESKELECDTNGCTTSKKKDKKQKRKSDLKIPDFNSKVSRKSKKLDEEDVDLQWIKNL